MSVVSESRQSSAQYVTHALILCLIVSLALLIWPALFVDEFSYRRAWVSAHFATMARNFVNYGILELGMVPVQNAGPLTDSPDYYLHWPPLFPIFLSWIFAAFGQANANIVHALSTFLIAGQALLLGVWAKRNLSATASLIVVICFLNVPVVARFSFVGLHLHMALLLALLAVFVFDISVRRERSAAWLCVAGPAIYGLACFTSWEPILLLPGLAAYWLCYPGRRLAFATLTYGAVGILSVSATLALYFLKNPDVVVGLFNRAAFRAGLSSYTEKSAVTIHDFAGTVPIDYEFTFVNFLHDSSLNIAGIGIPGLAILGLVAITIRCRRARWFDIRSALVAKPLLTMGGLWVLLMPQHFSIHEYQAIVFAAPAAIATGVLAETALNYGWFNARYVEHSRKFGQSVMVVLGAALVVMRLGIDIDRYRTFAPDKDRWIHFGQTLARTVPSNGIVAVPWQDMVPTFYSDRHLIRGITSFALFESNLVPLASLCPECPLFLVSYANEPTGPEKAYETVWQGDEVRILKVPRLSEAPQGPSKFHGQP